MKYPCVRGAQHAAIQPEALVGDLVPLISPIKMLLDFSSDKHNHKLVIVLVFNTLHFFGLGRSWSS
eukprot:4477542-Pyramimonas_sp.AAC.2